jgi:hypothetical protein
MLILSGGVRYRYLSDRRSVICPILGTVFVLWFEAYERSFQSFPACGGVTATTLEGDESPVAFHA